MSMSKVEYNALYRACRELDDGPDYRNSVYAENMILTVLDFQMNVTAVNRALNHYRRKVGHRSHSGLKNVIYRFENTKRGNKRLARYLWSNNMWARAKFLRILLDEFAARGVRGQKSLKRWLESADFDRDVKHRFRLLSPKNHSVGFALFHWLCLRCGIDTIKPDVHILNFVKNTIGRTVGPVEAVQALMRIAKQQRRKGYRLDSAIWHAQRDGKQ